MPYDSSGHFTRIHNWENDRINDIDIVTDHHDEEDDNFAEGLSMTFLRDGRTPMEADLDVGNFKVKNLAAGSNGLDAVNKNQLDGVKSNLEGRIKVNVNTLYQVGDIKVSLQKQNHNNWLLCNGQAVSRSDYEDLFNLIGTNFGAGDGITTFNLPDYRGKFLRGLGGNSAADIYTTQSEGLPNISGRIWTSRNSSINSSFATGAFYMNTQNATGNGTGNTASQSWTVYMDASRSSKIYGASDHVTPINQAVNYFIKAKEE